MKNMKIGVCIQETTPMVQGQEFQLWFGNQSTLGGQVVVYQDVSNATFVGSGLNQLAWMVAGANPAVWLRFSWTIAYGFLWSAATPAVDSQQIVSADLATANGITLSHNANGFYFSSPRAASPSGALLIAEDQTVPSTNSAIVGIAMSRAGTLAAAARPNTNLSLTPVAAGSLGYQITFGNYNLEVGAVLTPSSLNPPAAIGFPQGTTVMTAVLGPSNGWTVAPGPPTSRHSDSFIDYRAGIGVVSATNPPGPKKQLDLGRGS
jgi:hypothetical protein